MPRIRRLATAPLLALLLACTLLVPAARAQPLVEIRTNHGTIAVELWPDKAPQSVAAFLQLVDEGFYDGTVFHRVIDGFIIQGGGFSTDYEPREVDTAIPNEADNGLSNRRGTVAMARTADPHSARNQFFINAADNPFLDHSSQTRRGWGYAVFGKVVEGMEVVDRIAALPTGQAGPFAEDAPLEAVIIERMVRRHEEQTRQ